MYKEFEGVAEYRTLAGRRGWMCWALRGVGWRRWRVYVAVEILHLIVAGLLCDCHFAAVSAILSSVELALCNAPGWLDTTKSL